MGSSPASESHILVNREPTAGIAIVTLNRPKSLNSLTRPMMNELARIIKSLDADKSVRVIILTGSGRSFCSGMDLMDAEDIFKGELKDFESDPLAQIERCRTPIIGAINGFAATAGFELALACDLLVATRDTKFMDTHVKVSVLPNWGLSQKLSRVIGVNRAREVSLSAKPISAEQAERWGMVNYVVGNHELLNKARGIAQDIAKYDQNFVQTYKAVINDGIKQDLTHALALEKERAEDNYGSLTKEHFQKMKALAAGLGNKKVVSKL